MRTFTVRGPLAWLVLVACVLVASWLLLVAVWVGMALLSYIAGAVGL